MATYAQGSFMAGYPIDWDPTTGFGMPLEYMIPSPTGQPSTSASQPMNQVNASAPQPTQPQDTAPASQSAVTPTSVPSPASPSNVSALWPTPQQRNLAMMLQPKSPTEVLAYRVPHANGVTWVFQDLVTGFVHHVNVPLVAQQQPNQMTAQNSHGNEMVLYQSPSNQSPQQVARTASAAQPMSTPNVQPASVALPITPLTPQAVPVDGQQID